LVSVEEYLRRTEKPNCEFVDGEVRPKAMPTWYHGLIQAALLRLLHEHGLVAAPEVTVRLSPTKFLVPDVIAATSVQLPYPTDPVLLRVEILSPDDGVGAMLAKCEQYHPWGVPFCWVIDPVRRVAWDYARGGEPLRVDASGVLQAGDVRVSVKELFAELKN